MASPEIYKKYIKKYNICDWIAIWKKYVIRYIPHILHKCEFQINYSSLAISLNYCMYQ